MVARPPAPVVMLGVPLMTISPPDSVPAAAVAPAFKVTAVPEISVVATFCDIVRLPVVVAILTVPPALTPFVLPTAPIFSAALLRKLTLPTPAPAASVPTLLAGAVFNA